ncbi:MAG: hypothetical protein H0S85_03325 [Desulfovibrionaceae bacterium]|jgi:hypothetical protein|nr:hypothetical protein [Desulfovibrionaceae bacterium]
MKNKKVFWLSAGAVALLALAGGLIWNHFYGRGDSPVWERVRMGEANATRVEPPRSERVPKDMLLFALNRTSPPPEPERPAAPAQPIEQQAPEVEQANGSDQGPREDRIVTWAFGDSLARLVAESYFPKGAHPEARKHGVLVLDAKRLNMHYGTRMTGLRVRSENPVAARRLVYEYVMPPTVLRMLYGMYADRFLGAVEAHAREQVRDAGAGTAPLTDAQVAELFSLASQHAAGLAAVLETCAGLDDLQARVAAYHDAIEATLDANEHFINVLQVYEELRDAAQQQQGVDPQQVEKARLAMEAAGKAYQQAIRHREQMRTGLIAKARPRRGPTLDEAEALYVARWTARRLSEGPSARASLTAMVEVLNDLSGRLAEHGQH